MKRNFGKIVVIAALLTGASLSADLPQPYDSIHSLPHTPYFVQDSYIFSNLVTTHNVSVAIDVDSQDGGVARYLAQQASNLPSLTKIYSVNMWHSNDNSQKHLFQRFLSNVAQEATTQLIIPIRMSSHEAAESLNVKADLISLVGANEQYTICNDILSWYPHLSDTGLLCGNNWDEDSVKAGVIKASMLLNVPVQINNNVWYFVKGS